MNKFKFYFILMFSGLILFSCNKSDDDDVVAVRDPKAQYDTDIATIETFMKTHYVKTLNTAAGTTGEMDVTLDVIPAGNPSGFISLWDRADKKSTTIDQNDFTYTIYYIEFRNGDPTKESPSRVDKVLTAYDGSYLDSSNGFTRFEYAPFPSTYIGLDEVIKGWTEIFRLFKPGTATVVSGQPTVYNDFGAGIMFIPSGLAYFNYPTSTIPSYSPLMFSFKLYGMERADQDADGILSINEDINGNGIFTDDDTDGDGYPDYVDADDDGDGTPTKTETIIPGIVPVSYYPYNGAALDVEGTAIDERLGVPSCATGTTPADYTSPTRLRKYLNPNCN